MDAARRAASGKLPPEHWGEREADEVVEGLPRLLCVHERHVDRSRRRERLTHGALGDLAKADALRRHARRDRPPLDEALLNVPGDRLAFAVGIHRKVQRARTLHSSRNLRHETLLGRIRFEAHCEVPVGDDRTRLRRELAHVAATGEDGEAVA